MLTDILKLVAPDSRWNELKTSDRSKIFANAEYGDGDITEDQLKKEIKACDELFQIGRKVIMGNIETLLADAAVKTG